MERDQQTKKELEIRLYPQVLPLGQRTKGGRWGTQKDPSPIFYFSGHPLPCSPQLDFQHINHLSHFEIIWSGYYPSIVMTPSAKVSIRQVRIRRAENRAGQRAEHMSVLV